MPVPSPFIAPSRESLSAAGDWSGGVTTSRIPVTGRAGLDGIPLHGSASGRRLGQAVLVYLVVATLFVTWAPFRFAPFPVHGFSGIWSPSDLILNVVMFLPLGFLWQAARGREGSTPWWLVGVAGALLSLVIELGQLFIVERVTSLLDVATNGLGAAIGARAFNLVRPRVHLGASTVSTLALELPLTGLVLLLTPLLWVSGFGSNGTGRMWLMLPVAIFGGAVLGAVHGAHLQSTGRVGRPALLGGVALWFLVSALPGASSHPDVLVTGTVLAVGAAWLRSRAVARLRLQHQDRRVELPTLRLVLPLLAVYLTLSALWPLDRLGGSWSWGWMLAPANPELSRVLLMQSLEYLAAFTLVGYITAEFHGRETLGYRDGARRVFRNGLLLVLALEVARGWSPVAGASVSLGILALGAALFGGWLYHLQRDHVRTLLSRPARIGKPFA